MTFDIDACVQRICPWDLYVTLGGIDYAIRPLTLGDMLSIQNLSQMAEQQLREFCASLFDGLKPEISSMTGEQITGLLGICSAYAQERAGKNSLAIARACAQAVGLLAAETETPAATATSESKSSSAS